MIEYTVEDLPDLIEARNRAVGTEKYFIDFLISLMRVERKYMLWPYNMSNNDNIQTIERVFAYEFYHQWRNVTEEFYYQNLIINGEIRKDGTIYRHPNIGTVYPDLILHEQQNNMNRQLIACEIKTSKALNHANGKKGFGKDLIKLSNYLHDLNFEYCIFLQVLNSENCLEEQILPYLRNRQNNFNDLDRIYFVVKESDRIRYGIIQNIINELDV